MRIFLVSENLQFLLDIPVDERLVYFLKKVGVESEFLSPFPSLFKHRQLTVAGNNTIGIGFKFYDLFYVFESFPKQCKNLVINFINSKSYVLNAAAIFRFLHILKIWRKNNDLKLNFELM